MSVVQKSAPAASARHLEVVHVLVRQHHQGAVKLLLYPHRRWAKPDGVPFWTLPAKKTVIASPNRAGEGRSVEAFLDAIMQEDLGLPPDRYYLDQELDPIAVELPSPTRGVPTQYDIYACDVWLEPTARELLPERLSGAWLTPNEILDHPKLSPTTAAVVRRVLEREARLDAQYAARPEDEQRPDAPRRLLRDVPQAPTMEMLALRWHERNRGGVRCLSWTEIETILAAGSRAFNPLVADPYLRYQNQGYGLTYSFFTHKDRQDLHLHGLPIVEVYGVLSGGPLELWTKPKQARGSSAWSRRLVEPFGWAEIAPEQCHIVRWLGEGIGIVFKGGTTQLAGVGRQGVCGKTLCRGCTCAKPVDVIEIERHFASLDN